MASLAPIQGSINCSLDDIDLNALKVSSLAPQIPGKVAGMAATGKLGEICGNPLGVVTWHFCCSLCNFAVTQAT